MHENDILHDMIFFNHLKNQIWESFPGDSEKDFMTWEHSSEEISKQFELKSNSWPFKLIAHVIISCFTEYNLQVEILVCAKSVWICFSVIPMNCKNKSVQMIS